MLTMSVLNSWLGDVKNGTHTRRMYGFTVVPYWIFRTFRTTAMAGLLTLMLVITTFSGGRAVFEWANCPAVCTTYGYPGSNSRPGGPA